MPLWYKIVESCVDHTYLQSLPQMEQSLLREIDRQKQRRPAKIRIWSESQAQPSHCQALYPNTYQGKNISGSVDGIITILKQTVNC